MKNLGASPPRKVTKLVQDSNTEMTNRRENQWGKRAVVTMQLSTEKIKKAEPIELLKTTLTEEQMVRPTERMVGLLDRRELSPNCRCARYKAKIPASNWPRETALSSSPPRGRWSFRASQPRANHRWLKGVMLRELIPRFSIGLKCPRNVLTSGSSKMSYPVFSGLILLII